MRVTQQLLFSNFMRDINKNRGEMGRIQSDLSSGKMVRVPSQGPVEFERSRIIEENIRKEEQYQNNISTGLRHSRAAQEALDETLDRLIEIKGALVQGATDTSSSSTRQTMARKIEGIRDTLVNTLNLSSGDRYLFAGTNSSQPPFGLDEEAEGGVSNSSSTSNPRVLVADGVSLDVSVNGVDLRDTGAGDLFGIIDDIIAALDANDTETLSQLMPSADRAIEHVSNEAAKVGININRMDFLFEQYESSKINQRAEVSNLVDTDYAMAFSELQRNQIAYESAMAVHSTMFSNTLLNFI
ncbi:MAG: hypothetical protein LAT84_07315 [Balneolia bacterium]|nr:hypothetical protein [Balneolia bacterium]